MKDTGQHADGDQYRQRNTPMHDALVNQPQPAQTEQARTEQVGIAGDTVEKKFVGSDTAPIAELAEQCGAGQTVCGDRRPSGQRERKLSKTTA